MSQIKKQQDKLAVRIAIKCQKKMARKKLKKLLTMFDKNVKIEHVANKKILAKKLTKMLIKIREK